MFLQQFFIACLLLLTATLVTSPVVASEQDISFEADSVTVNQDDGSMLAVGNVEMQQAGMTLTADEVRYNRDEDRAVASGDVTFIDADGGVHRSDVITLDTEFTHIVADTLRSRYPDGSFFIADSGDIRTDSVSVYDSSRFSPCDCDFENGETPIWDLRATSTRHNVETRTIIHRNVRMHIMNLPIGYLPYLAHPDWTVRRRSGFLAPSFIINTDLGLTASIPYFMVIDETSDAEITPYRFQHRGNAVRTRYRRFWDRSEFGATLYTASVETYKKNRENVAAIDAAYGARIGQGWDVDMRLRRASQDTFMRRYKFDSDTSLKSEIVAQKQTQDRYYRVEMWDIQGLNAADTGDTEPSVLPHVFYEKIRPGMRPSQRIKTEISAMQVDNDEEHDMSRWTGNVELSDEIEAGGITTELKAGVIGTYYSIQKKPAAATTKTDDLGRVTPMASVEWRSPISVSTASRSGVLEPRLQLAYVGGEDKTDKIPNRDSADYRVDEANLFLLNRYQGYDYLRPGTRADVGVSAISNDAFLGEVSGFIGASYRLSGKPSRGLAVNDDDNLSDIVASLSVNPDIPVQVEWSGRMASDDLKLNESRTSLSGTVGSLSLGIEHLQLAKPYFQSAASDLEELKLSATYNLPGGWAATGSQVWDLSNGKTKRDSSTASLTWTGGIQDCLTFNLDYDRDLESDRDISASDQFLLTINFKYLGSISQNDLFKKDE
jgi:LPS-assembly protein